jgi:hypothetical protein
MVEEARRLRDHAEWLLSLDRRTGPSPHEAADEARACITRADTLECDAFYGTPVSVANAH